MVALLYLVVVLDVTHFPGFQLSMPMEQLMANFRAYVEDICELQKAPETGRWRVDLVCTSERWPPL